MLCNLIACGFKPYHLVAGSQPAGKELDANDGKDDKLKEAKHGHRGDGWDGPDQRQHHYLHALCYTHTHAPMVTEYVTDTGLQQTHCKNFLQHNTLHAPCDMYRRTHYY